VERNGLKANEWLFTDPTNEWWWSSAEISSG